MSLSCIDERRCTYRPIKPVDKPAGPKTHPARARKAPAAAPTEPEPATETNTEAKEPSDAPEAPAPDVVAPPPELPPKSKASAQGEQDATLDDEDAEGDVDDEIAPGPSPPFRTPAFLTKKNGIERNAAGWALPTAAAAASAALKALE